MSTLAVVLASLPPRVIFRDMDTDTVVAILALVGVIVTAVVAPLIQHKERGSHIISDMTASQSNLQDQIDKLDKRLVSMYAEDQRVKEQVARQQAKMSEQEAQMSYQRAHMAKQQQAMDEDTRYIRAIAHWLQQACEVMDIPDDWSAEHPKPHLPDSIRSRITKKSNEEDSK